MRFLESIMNFFLSIPKFFLSSRNEIEQETVPIEQPVVVSNDQKIVPIEKPAVVSTKQPVVVSNSQKTFPIVQPVVVSNDQETVPIEQPAVVLTNPNTVPVDQTSSLDVISTEQTTLIDPSFDQTPTENDKEVHQLILTFDSKNIDKENKKKIMNFIIKNLENNLGEIVSVLFDERVKNETVKDIKNFFFTPNQPIYGKLLVMDAIKKKIEDKCLNLPREYIEDENVHLIMMILRHLPYLTSLDISGNYFTKVNFADEFGEILKSLTNLKHLDISEMGIDSNILKKLSGGLGALINLEKLVLSRNDIRHEGAVIVSTILPRLKNLEELVITCSNIDDVGTMAIFDVLKSSKVKKLDLSSNGITADCHNTIIERLKSGEFPNLKIFNDLSKQPAQPSKTMAKKTANTRKLNSSRKKN